MNSAAFGLFVRVSCVYSINVPIKIAYTENLKTFLTQIVGINTIGTQAVSR
jgi:hypothetical protein